jgi:quercetin dioxygenase-like cupin family protein
MSDRAQLPEFVQDALEADVRPLGGADAEGVGRAGCELIQLEEPAAIAEGLGSAQLDSIERSLGALLEAAWPGAPLSRSGSARAAGAVGRVEDFAPSRALSERLLASIERAPFRYAPFFARAAELFDLPEAAIIAELARLGEPKTWRFAGLPGIHDAAIQGGPRVESAETLFVRFAPGVRFPRHRHTGLERVLVLEGSYRDSAGVVHRAGELREWAEGTEHGFVVDAGEPCIFASVVFGRRFSAWPLRALASVLGR